MGEIYGVNAYTEGPIGVVYFELSKQRSSGDYEWVTIATADEYRRWRDGLWGGQESRFYRGHKQLRRERHFHRPTGEDLAMAGPLQLHEWLEWDVPKGEAAARAVELRRRFREAPCPRCGHVEEAEDHPVFSLGPPDGALRLWIADARRRGLLRPWSGEDSLALGLPAPRSRQIDEATPLPPVTDGLRVRRRPGGA